MANEKSTLSLLLSLVCVYIYEGLCINPLAMLYTIKYISIVYWILILDFFGLISNCKDHEVGLSDFKVDY